MSEYDNDHETQERRQKVLEPSIIIRKVSILKDELYNIAKKVANDDDLVIVKTVYAADGPHYEIEKIIGDPVSYLMKE